MGGVWANRDGERAELARLSLEIDKLRDQQKELIKSLTAKAETFQERLQCWFDDDDLEMDGWIPSGPKHPKVGEYFRKQDMDRHRTYIFKEYFEDDIYGVLHPKECPDFTISTEMKELLEEVIATRLGGFTCDW